MWERYYHVLSEDNRRAYPTDDARVLEKTAQQVESMLERMGKSFANFNLAHLHKLQNSELERIKDIYDALDTPVPFEYFEARKKLNNEQKAVYKCIMHHVKTNKSGAFFVDGPGGTVKTFLYCALYEKV